MKKIICLIAIVCSLQLNAQKKSRFSAQINYGLVANYGSQNYMESGRPDGKAFLNKNLIGSLAGFNLNYRVTERASWGIGFSESTNKSTINYNTRINGVGVFINDFDIRESNRFYQIFYQRKFSKKAPQFKYEIGLFYVRYQLQEVVIGGSASFEQRNFNNSNLEEGGAFIGFQYETMIDKKFALGIKSRLYYTISTEEMEILTFTPTLTYHF